MTKVSIIWMFFKIGLKHRNQMISVADDKTQYFIQKLSKYKKWCTIQSVFTNVIANMNKNQFYDD